MSDATPSYRGYRLQTLYILARILESSEQFDSIFQPEGADEDLAVWSQAGSLLEAIQVKAYSKNLTLSTFDPKKDDSFIYRGNRQLEVYPDATIKIVSFGEVGEELDLAVREDGRDRSKVAQKISKEGKLSEPEARQLLDRWQIERFVESELKKQVLSAIRMLCVGTDPDSAFDLMNWWLYDCAENKRKIDRGDVIQKINSVGQFIAYRSAHHNEWFRSVVPLEDSEIDSERQENLSREFYLGVSARYEHVLANVDRLRPSKLNEISKKFQEKPIVIVHGASGQGKTTLAYRYLHDFFPSLWRFRVRLVEDRQQATNIATALLEHAKAIGVPVAVYLDVNPNDRGWYELVKQLSRHPNIRVLVTVREEDFRRASVSGVELQFTELDLQFDRPEAEEIYQSLVEIAVPDRFLDFEDAWNRFGGNGPLMEFVYLVTQGDSLRERLNQQIRRIEDELEENQGSNAKLDFLRLVAVASAFEARLKLRELVRFLKLPKPRRTLELFEKEYLLKTSSNGTLVGGLHPIRSSILVDILTEFDSWGESASACLPFIFEPDVGSFLLYAFSRYRSELNPLLLSLNTYQPERWIAIAGVIRALIWLGIKEYVEENQDLIVEEYEKVQSGWSIVLNFDIANASPGVTEQWLSSMSRMRLISEEGISHINSLRSRQTNRERVFTRSADWLSGLVCEPVSPEVELDWSGMAQTLFWMGLLGVSVNISSWLARVDLSIVVETLPLEIIADISLGLFYANEAIYRSWIELNYAALIERFREETQTVAWEDNGNNLRSHFIFKLLQSKTSALEESIDREDTQRMCLNASMDRLKLLRRFFPDRERYGSRGYGHLISINTELHDETEKDIPYSNFPLQWLVSLNATFRSLGEQHFRPATWEDYTQAVMDLRRTNLQIFQQLLKGITVYLRKQKMTLVLGSFIDSDLWSRGIRLLKFYPWFPICAFDEWGFVTEKMERAAANSSSNNPEQNQVKKQHREQQNLALQKYYAYLKKSNQYFNGCSNFLDQAGCVLNFNPYFRHGENFEARNIARDRNIDLGKNVRLSILNLGDTVKVLPDFQREFRRLLSSFVEPRELANLESLEQKVYESLWCSWYSFAFHPGRRDRNTTNVRSGRRRGFGNQESASENDFNKKVTEVKKKIRKELDTASSELEDAQVSILSDSVFWEEDRVLWIKVDGKSVAEVYQGVEVAIAAIQQGISSVHNNELRHYAIDLTWKNFAIVPLVKSKSLGAEAYLLSSMLFSWGTNREFNWWNFVPVAIPSDAFKELGLFVWDDSRLSLAKELLGTIGVLSLAVSHIRDLQRLPQPLDALGNELIHQYLQEIAPSMSEAAQAVINVEVKIADYVDEVVAEQERGQRPYLFEALELLANLHRQILPSSDRSYSSDREVEIEVFLNFDATVEWANRLDLAQQQILLVYSLWVSDVLRDV